MGIGPAITSIGAAIGNTAVGAAKFGGAVAVSPLTIPMKAAGYGATADAIGRGAGTGLAALTGASTLQTTLSGQQSATAVPAPTIPANPAASIVGAVSGQTTANNAAATSVAGGLNSQVGAGVSSADVSKAFTKSPGAIVLDAISIPLMASPETARIFTGVKGIVESIQDANNIPKALDIIDKVGMKKMDPKDALVALSKTGVSLKTMGDIMDTTKSLWELRDAPTASKKKASELINSQLETPDKITDLLEKAAKSNVPATKQVIGESLGVDQAAMQETPTLRQQAFVRLFPGASKADYKEFDAIYGPLVRQKQDPLMAEAMGEVDPWQEAVKQYANSLSMPNPLQNTPAQAEQPSPAMSEQGMSAPAAPGQAAEEPRVPMLNKDGVLGMVKKSQVWDAIQQGYKPAKGQ